MSLFDYLTSLAFEVFCFLFNVMSVTIVEPYDCQLYNLYDLNVHAEQLNNMIQTQWFYMPISHSLEALSLKLGHIYCDVFVLWTFWQQTQTSHIKKYTHIATLTHPGVFQNPNISHWGIIFRVSNFSKHADCLASKN